MRGRDLFSKRVTDGLSSAPKGRFAIRTVQQNREHFRQVWEREDQNSRQERPRSILVANLHGQSAHAGLPNIVETDGSGGVMVLVNLTRNDALSN